MRMPPGLLSEALLAQVAWLRELIVLVNLEVHIDYKEYGTR
jgi:hypothetical protein